MLCPRWNSNRVPALGNPPLPRKHPQSGPIRHRYDPIRSPGCGHCPHPLFLPHGSSTGAGEDTPAVARLPAFPAPRPRVSGDSPRPIIVFVCFKNRNHGHLPPFRHLMAEPAKTDMTTPLHLLGPRPIIDLSTLARSCFSLAVIPPPQFRLNDGQLTQAAEVLGQVMERATADGAVARLQASMRTPTARSNAAASKVMEGWCSPGRTFAPTASMAAWSAGFL